MYNKSKTSHYKKKKNVYKNRMYNAKKDSKKKSDKLLNIMIFIVIIAISYVSMDMFNISFPSQLTSKVSSILNSDFLSFSDTKDKVVSFVNNTASVFNSKKTDVLDSSSSLKLQMPVNGEVITSFSDTTHPVFNTTIKPRGIEIETKKSEEVFASIDGKVTNIIDSSYGGKRVVFDIGNNMTVVYDGVKNCFVKKGDNIKTGEIIGTMGESEKGDVLGFEVWVDNTAVDPVSYMDTKQESDKGV